MPRLWLLVFLPAFITTLAYTVLVLLQQALPALLVFYQCATVLLFPLGIVIILCASKKRSTAKSRCEAPLQWWKNPALWIVDLRLCRPYVHHRCSLGGKAVYCNATAYPRTMMIITCVLLLFNGFVAPSQKSCFSVGTSPAMFAGSARPPRWSSQSSSRSTISGHPLPTSSQSLSSSLELQPKLLFKGLFDDGNKTWTELLQFCKLPGQLLFIIKTK